MMPDFCSIPCVVKVSWVYFIRTEDCSYLSKTSSGCLASVCNCPKIPAVWQITSAFWGTEFIALLNQFTNHMVKENWDTHMVCLWCLLVNHKPITIFKKSLLSAKPTPIAANKNFSCTDNRINTSFEIRYKNVSYEVSTIYQQQSAYESPEALDLCMVV